MADATGRASPLAQKTAAMITIVDASDRGVRLFQSVVDALSSKRAALPIFAHLHTLKDIAHFLHQAGVPAQFKAFLQHDLVDEIGHSGQVVERFTRV